MSDLNHSSEVLSVLEDLRRHLVWQAGSAGGVILSELRPATSLRESLRAAMADAPASPSRSEAPRPPPPAASAPPVAARPAPAPVSPPAARPSPPAPTPRVPPAAVQPAPVAQPPPPVAVTPPAAATERRTLDEVRRELGDCTRCKLCKTRKNIVFGVGNPRAELVFVGEGPGEQEDIQGIPFVGKAGELLTKMIEAMGFTRDEIYICNVVKCRPPGNRNPEPDEIEACEPFLMAQLASIQPKAIVALGKFAAQTLLREDTPISRLRGQWREYCGVQLMPTFHPAYLLRNPADKKLVWQDLQQVMRVFGKEPLKKREQ